MASTFYLRFYYKDKNTQMIASAERVRDGEESILKIKVNFLLFQIDKIFLFIV